MKNSPQMMGLAVLVASGVFGLTLALKLPLLSGVLYGVAVWLAVQSRERQAVLGVAGLSTLLLLLTLGILPPPPAQLRETLAGGGLALLAIWIAAQLGNDRLRSEQHLHQLLRSAEESSRRRTEELEATNRQLKTEMAERQQGEAA